jgi:hypothetical protein
MGHSAPVKLLIVIFVQEDASMQTSVSDSSNSSVAITLKSVTPHALAVTMLRSVMETDKSWRMTDALVTSEAHTKVPMTCEFYQLRIFLDLVKQRFGAGVFGLVESSLISVTNVGDKPPGIDWFSKNMTAISLARELGPSEDAPDNKQIGIDCQVADQVLKFLSESDEEKQRFRLILAESLTYARVWAEGIFPELVAKIEFDPVSVAFVKVETAYKGLTNRWRERPGCFERHLQRMEGNPIFPEPKRNPTDEDILLARSKDDAELEKLVLDVESFLSEFKSLIEQGQVPRSTITDLMQHRIEPLMVRAAEIGSLPPAQLHLETLKELIESMLNSLNLASDVTDGFRKDWRRRTNVFIAQEWRDDRPISEEGDAAALLCENVEEVRDVLEIYQELDSPVVDSLRELARLHFEIAELEGFHLPGAAEKRALFGSEAEAVSNQGQVKPRPWWRVWS